MFKDYHIKIAPETVGWSGRQAIVEFVVEKLYLWSEMHFAVICEKNLGADLSTRLHPFF